MREVAIVGIGQIPVREYWSRSLRHMAFDALQAAWQESGVEEIDTLYVGNALADELSDQKQLAALVADFAGQRGIAAARVEAGDASGALALHQAYLAVASGLYDTALAVGVEQMSAALPVETVSATARFLDQEFEAAMGATLNAVFALMMRRYMYEFKVPREAFFAFPGTAHRNGVNNPNAMYRKAIKESTYARVGMVSDPLNMFDVAPICDGAAAVMLCAVDKLADLRSSGPAPVRIAASSVATDSVALHDRQDPLFLEAAFISSQLAFRQATLSQTDIQLFELHDSSSIMAALSLEACGLAPRGESVRLAADGLIALDGPAPISSMGGLKARGNPAGATGLYQIAEVAQQLRGEAGANQIAGIRAGLAQSLGGSGATAVTHILTLL